jgi:hypothetical protein
MTKVSFTLGATFREYKPVDHILQQGNYEQTIKNLLETY